ncbi:MAG: response regulator [Chloroflexi bacterium]|nr:response regulator [Chloroflexota bacterium]
MLAKRPDLILLDLVLPDRSGVEVLRAVRAQRATASTPVIVVTARGPAEELALTHRGRMQIVKNSSFTAGELVRCLDLISKSLPPNYVRA